MLLIAMLLLAVVATAWATRPLWRAAVDAGLRRRTANVLAYRQRVAELEADRGAGLLDTDTAGLLRAELDTRLLRDAEVADAGSPVTGGPRRARWASLVLVLLILAVGFCGYFVEGSWRAQQRIAQGAQTAQATPDSVAAMVETLAAKLRDNPNDVDGWALLGRSYFVMGRYADAAEAYASGSRVVNDREPDLLVNQGESLALADERNLQGRPMDLFRAALAIDPDHGKALWYAGLAAEQAGADADARRYWTALSNQTLPGELRPLLEARLQRVGGAITTPAPGPAAAAESESETETATATAAPVLRLDVSIAAELAARAPDDAVLFVFARAAGGPPMPLAVHRGLAGDLPRRIVLDDSMSMQPGLSLSGFDHWEVVARISRAGGVQAASGDLQGRLTVARQDLGDAALALQIDQVIP